MALARRSVKSLSIAGLAENEVWRLEDATAEYWLMAEGGGVFAVWRRKLVGEQYAKFLGTKVCFGPSIIEGGILCIMDPNESNPVNIVVRLIEGSRMGDIPHAGSLEDEVSVPCMAEFDFV